MKKPKVHCPPHNPVVVTEEEFVFGSDTPWSSRAWPPYCEWCNVDLGRQPAGGRAHA